MRGNSIGPGEVCDALHGASIGHGAEGMAKRSRIKQKKEYCIIYLTGGETHENKSSNRAR